MGDRLAEIVEIGVGDIGLDAGGDEHTDLIAAAADGILGDEIPATAVGVGQRQGIGEGAELRDAQTDLRKQLKGAGHNGEIAQAQNGLLDGDKFDLRIIGAVGLDDSLVVGVLLGLDVDRLSLIFPHQSRCRLKR